MVSEGRGVRCGNSRSLSRDAGARRALRAAWLERDRARRARAGDRAQSVFAQLVPRRRARVRDRRARTSHHDGRDRTRLRSRTATDCAHVPMPAVRAPASRLPIRNVPSRCSSRSRTPACATPCCRMRCGTATSFVGSGVSRTATVCLAVRARRPSARSCPHPARPSEGTYLLIVVATGRPAALTNGRGASDRGSGVWAGEPRLAAEN